MMLNILIEGIPIVTQFVHIYNGATTLSIKTLSIMTLSIMTFGITTIGIRSLFSAHYITDT
jgi:hypothetical protein